MESPSIVPPIVCPTCNTDNRLTQYRLINGIVSSDGIDYEAIDWHYIFCQNCMTNFHIRGMLAENLSRNIKLGPSNG